MRRTISQISKISGVSVRTLHYYDEIGLLSPSEIIAETGYRYYDEDALEKLMQILFYKELDFSLKDIALIMNLESYNRKDALVKQRQLLYLKQQRLNRLIKVIDDNLKGGNEMSFKEFDTSEIDEAKQKYSKEVKERWGSSKAFKECESKTKSYQKQDWERVNEGMNELLKDFATYIGKNPGDEQVQELVSKWQRYITDNYYECTKEILAGLGAMYIMDERFTKNMDKYAEGTTLLISQAIEIYCK